MNIFRPGLIQVAGIRSVEEGRMVLDRGVHLLGFPLRLPVHAEDVSEDRAREIIGVLGPARCVVITYEDDPRRLKDLCRFLNVRAAQIHGSVSPDVLARMKAGGLTLIKSYVVGRDSLPPEEFVRAYAPFCDAFITDTFDPASGASGATGRVHDWAVSAELVRCSPLPVLLAGGLRPENVRAAVAAVAPAGVDVHTGVEDASGAKDSGLVAAFVREARAGFAGLAP